jgi:hypothetical protein
MRLRDGSNSHNANPSGERRLLALSSQADFRAWKLTEAVLGADGFGEKRPH